MRDVSKMVDAVLSALDKPMSALAGRIKALEERKPEKGDQGLAGEKGADGAPGRDGIDGKDGANGTDGRDGADGKDGSPGPEGPAGKHGPPPTREQIVEAILSMPDVLDEAVQRYLAASPPPAGKDGRDGIDGAPGEKGVDGRDGADVVDLLIDREGSLVATLSNGRTKTLGPVVGKDGDAGEAGKDGRDGLGFEDMTEVVADDGRTIIRRYERGDQALEFRHSMAVVLDRGVFKEGQTYQAGDGVTWGGSFWIAQEQTTEKPDSGKGWRLAVKRGRDGKDGQVKPVPDPKPVKVG
jgi:integrin beta 3